jgi:hypothetical protein
MKTNEKTLVSVKSKSLEETHRKGGKSSQKTNTMFLFQSTLCPYKHICSCLRGNRLSERRFLKNLVKINVPSRSARTSKINFFY